MAYQKIDGDTPTTFEDGVLVTLGNPADGHRDSVELALTYPMSRLIPGQFGDYRWLNGRESDGTLVKIRAAKILLERLEKANVTTGDRVKIHTRLQQPAEGSNKRAYRTYDVWVDKLSDAGEFDPSPAEPARNPEATPASRNDPPPF
jgi:hypothetical protein